MLAWRIELELKQNIVTRLLNENQDDEEYPSDAVVKDTLMNRLILGFTQLTKCRRKLEILNN